MRRLTRQKFKPLSVPLPTNLDAFKQTFLSLKKDGHPGRNRALDLAQRLALQYTAVNRSVETIKVLRRFEEEEKLYQHFQFCRRVTILNGTSDEAMRVAMMAAQDDLFFQPDRSLYAFNLAIQKSRDALFVQTEESDADRTRRISTTKQEFLSARRQYERKYTEQINNIVCFFDWDSKLNHQIFFPAAPEPLGQRPLHTPIAIAQWYLNKPDDWSMVKLNEINRFFLDAVLTINHSYDWDITFRRILIELIQYLFQSIKPQPWRPHHSLSHRKFDIQEKTYAIFNETFLCNLYFLARYQSIYWPIPYVMEYRMNSLDHHFFLESLENIVRNPLIEQRRIFINDHFKAIGSSAIQFVIRTESALYRLLQHSEENITAAHRAQCIQGLSNRLPDIFYNDTVLHKFFSLPLSQLAMSERDFMLEKLPLEKIFTTLPSLMRFLTIDEALLTSEQRTRVLQQIDWNQVVNTSNKLSYLISLLSHEKFSVLHRKIMIDALITRLPTLINNSFSLHDLLRQLPETIFSVGDRQQLLDTLISEIENALPHETPNGKKLFDGYAFWLFLLPYTCFTAAHRERIIHLLEIRPELLTHHDAINFLVLSEIDLDSALRERVINIIKTNPHLINDELIITAALPQTLTETNLNVSLRDYCFNSPEIIRRSILNFRGLYRLLSLPEKEFSDECRSVLLNTVNIAEMVVSTADFNALYPFLQLSTTQLDNHHYKKMIQIMRENSRLWPSDVDQLTRLFSLPTDRFTPTYRQEVWSTLKDHLPSILQKKSDPKKLHQFITQLDEAQRDQILSMMSRPMTAALCGSPVARANDAGFFYRLKKMVQGDNAEVCKLTQPP
ncbi:MAG: hypothetical protein A3F13_06185 [Gammaproteobacteria bacterium RIFCSPHIGHO2_12_FULL_40_19]|nr:MAG: hypothetical protein A3F13_06185 [Gammaproteobacteria bacterium RIFCSPHIGHO2_12_FULL_40_19]